MNLKVYSHAVYEEVKDTEGKPELDSDGKPKQKLVREELSRTLNNVTHFECDPHRNTFTVHYRSLNGTATVEHGEFDDLFSKGEVPGELFGLVKTESAVGHLTDPTTVPTGGITGNVGDKTSTFAPGLAPNPSNPDESLSDLKKRLSEQNAKNPPPQKVAEVKPGVTDTEVDVASGVGHLTDPTTKDTSSVGPGATMSVPSPVTDKKTAGAPTLSGEKSKK